jgi:hypothetical protein
VQLVAQEFVTDSSIQCRRLVRPPIGVDGSHWPGDVQTVQGLLAGLMHRIAVEGDFHDHQFRSGVGGLIVSSGTRRENSFQTRLDSAA